MRRGAARLVKCITFQHVYIPPEAAPRSLPEPAIQRTLLTGRAQIGKTGATVNQHRQMLSYRLTQFGAPLTEVIESPPPPPARKCCCG